MRPNYFISESLSIYILVIEEIYLYIYILQKRKRWKMKEKLFEVCIEPLTYIYICKLRIKKLKRKTKNSFEPDSNQRPMDFSIPLQSTALPAELSKEPQ